jgi:FlaA1/EpsC-like NDP-sugar epimerase
MPIEKHFRPIMITNFWQGTAGQDLESSVLGRAQSLFEEDLRTRLPEISAALRNGRILVIGGAGSIGSVNVEMILNYGPECVHVVDTSENGLAELVRNLRSSQLDIRAVDFRTLPLDFGGPIMERVLAEAPPYDVVLNFAALKHVRSEKDVYSLLEMLATNVVKQHRFRGCLDRHHPNARYFAVSTDKAANPTSLMGASKRLMEDVIFEKAKLRNVASARFANVAFSNGSLLQSFLIRLHKRQVLAAPRDTQRYFVTLRESGEICLLAGLTAPNGFLLVPRFEPQSHLRLLEDIAERVLRYHGLEPVRFTDEDDAREAVEPLLAMRRYPLLVTPLDTTGEKPYEEFAGAGEHPVEVGLKQLLGIAHLAPASPLQPMLEGITALINCPDRPVTKAHLVALLRDHLPTLQHVETGKSLDQRI